MATVSTGGGSARNLRTSRIRFIGVKPRLTTALGPRTSSARRSHSERRGSRRAGLSLAPPIEGLAVLGCRQEAASLYPRVKEVLEKGTLASMIGLLERFAGIAAAAGRDWEVAERHFQTALRQADELPHRIEQADVRRWYARMLMDRDARGDRESARRMLTEAAEMHGRIGMPGHIEIAQAMLWLSVSGGHVGKA